MMAVNLCQEHFQTGVSTNKLCADGYDVTNLVSADPALRRRGFKLEYFLRPPVQVTLRFGFLVDLCRVDVQLWPWGMDQGQSSKRVEISTSSGPSSAQTSSLPSAGPQGERRVQKVNQRSENRGQRSGQRWSRGESADAQKPSGSDLCDDFKLVGRCELRDATEISFSRPGFCPRPPFLDPPAPPRQRCRREELWSRGAASVGSVAQLRVTMPFGGAASALGLKSLAVWGRPARCCPPEEVQRIQNIHRDHERRSRPPGAPPRTRPPAKTTSTPSHVSVPEEFLDPLTQEVMTLPMLLPSGVSVDTSTLDEYQKREATWGRARNDPFTGVAFTSSSQPLPNPQLKSRIDLFLLREGVSGRAGVLGRTDPGMNPSRLVQEPDPRENREQKTSSGPSSPRQKSPTSDGTKRSRGSEPEPSADQRRVAQSKRMKVDPDSHEQRLSASLDEALSSVLRGRPSFTANLPTPADPDPVPDPDQAPASRNTPAEQTCVCCASELSLYSRPSAPVYRLLCGHLLCRSCLHLPPLASSSTSTSSSSSSSTSSSSSSSSSLSSSSSSQVCCRRCRSLSARSSVTRVHH